MARKAKIATETEPTPSTEPAPVVVPGGRGGPAMPAPPTKAALASGRALAERLLVALQSGDLDKAASLHAEIGVLFGGGE